MSSKPLTCKVVRGVLKVEIGVAALQQAAQNHEGFWQPVTDAYALVVSDPLVFAEDVKTALLDEAEDGSTPLHHLFDAAILAASEQGSEGLDYDAMEQITDAEELARKE